MTLNGLRDTRRVPNESDVQCRRPFESKAHMVSRVNQGMHIHAVSPVASFWPGDVCRTNVNATATDAAVACLAFLKRLRA